MKWTILLTFILLFTGCDNPTSKSPVLATIKNLSGEIFYYPSSSENKQKLLPADINKRSLFSLDKIVVSKDAYLHLYVHEHGDMFLEPETTVILQQPQDGKKFKVFANVLKGVADCFIEKKGSNFAVQTPVAVAGVLGTKFKVAVSEEDTVVSLMESDHGVEIQNLKQSLKTPTLLKMTNTSDNIVLGAEVTIQEEVTDTPLQVKKIANILDYKFPESSKDGKLQWKSSVAHTSSRVHEYSR
ncbi:MAG: FecR domain-containing protein [Candidatus Cloacimonetes bacterium]|nr:FecR domain-containing protein [Candidatus Cloacimonadota bacterium]